MCDQWYNTLPKRHGISLHPHFRDKATCGIGVLLYSWNSCHDCVSWCNRKIPWLSRIPDVFRFLRWQFVNDASGLCKAKWWSEYWPEVYTRPALHWGSSGSHWGWKSLLEEMASSCCASGGCHLSHTCKECDWMDDPGVQPMQSVYCSEVNFLTREQQRTLWHMQLGHVNHKCIADAHKLADSIPDLLNKDSLHLCSFCLWASCTRLTASRKNLSISTR